MDDWLNTIPNVSQKLPKPINLPRNLDTKHSDRIVREFHTRQWANKRKVSNPNNDCQISHLYRMLESQGFAEDQTQARIFTSSLDKTDLIALYDFLAPNDQAASSTSFPTRHKAVGGLALLHAQRKMLVNLLQTRAPVRKFVSCFERVSGRDGQRPPRKDFRLIDINDRVKLLNARKTPKALERVTFATPQLRSKKFNLLKEAKHLRFLNCPD